MKYRFKMIMSLFFALFISLLTVSAQEGLLSSVRESARFRSGPGTDWLILATLSPNTPILIDARDGTNNFWVRGIVPSGEVGWIASSALNVSEADLNNLPIKGVEAPFTLPAPAGDSAPAAQPQAEAAPANDVAAAPPPAAPPARSSASTRGFEIGGHVADFGAEAINAMNRSGMTWAKKQIRYRDGMSGAEVQGVINDAHAKGFRILLGVVGYPNELTAGGYNERYANFVGELAALGADGIEVWNEPNLDREWTAGQISPASYTNLLAAAYNAIKARNPSTLVISGAPAPTGFFGGCTGNGCDDIFFLAGMRDAGAARYMDCVGVHYNEGILPPSARSGDPRGNSGYYTRYFLPMVETYSSAFGNRVPLCFTEIGYLSPEGYGSLSSGFFWAQNVTVAQQAAWLDQAVSLARNSGRVRLFIVWNIDFKNFGDDPMAGYAIIRPDGSCPACDALAN